MENGYVDEFLNLRCCGDILNVVNPIGKNSRKEITEAMSLIKRVKRLVFPRDRQFKVLDLCSGNALTAITAVHLYPNVRAMALDKRPRDRQWDKVERFEYVFADLYSLEGVKRMMEFVDPTTIIVSSHPCGDLAREIGKLFKGLTAKALFMMPCCDGSVKRSYPQELYSKMGKYFVWCWDLAQDVNGKISVDKRCLSPRNIVVSAIRGDK
jgi:hypothetical protein